MSNSHLIYTTQGNNNCTKCGKVLRKCKCPQITDSDNSDGVIRISKTTKGRRGSAVTLIKGLRGNASELKHIARKLKSRCGVGGTVKDGVIEIQGDQGQLIQNFFETAGEKVKLVGG
ncbi:MAG: hypothetical protein CMQ28_00625 [Gammaproteobacteria bacterium]|nr:hypothetical protein [Gammaproteobacteria bacterium]